MSDPAQIRSVVARFFNVPESAVTEDFVFPRDRLQGSVGRTTFHAALKRLAGADLPAAMTAISFRELLAPPSTQPSQSQVITAPQSPAIQLISGSKSIAQQQNGFGVGIDIESVEMLPAAKDPWSDPFFRDNFTEAEIAYCQRQSDPRMSFCGLWSAKEAAMKCDPDIAALRPVQIEIAHDEQRRPGLQLHGSANDHNLSDYILSISHAGQIAVAVCVRKPANAVPVHYEKRATEDIPSPPTEERVRERRLGRILIWLNLALSLSALILWCITWASKK